MSQGKPYKKPLFISLIIGVVLTWFGVEVGPEAVGVITEVVCQPVGCE